MDPDLGWVLGVLNCFPDVLVTEAAVVLPLVWWIQGVTPVILTAAEVTRTPVWGPVQTG